MKREEKRKLNKQRMIEAAVHLFSQKSFSSVSMRAIAKEANVSPALFYKYFDDQQHLYAEAMNIEAQKLVDKLTHFQELPELVEQYILYMYHDEVLYQMMAHFMLERSAKRPSISTYREIARLLERFEHALQPNYPYEAKQEAQLLFSTLNGLLISYKNHPLLSSDQALNLILSLSEKYLIHLKPIGE